MAFLFMRAMLVEVSVGGGGRFCRGCSAVNFLLPKCGVFGDGRCLSSKMLNPVPEVRSVSVASVVVHMGGCRSSPS
jgi:hypothetical protein